MTLTISKVIRGRAEKIFFAFETADRMHVVNKVVLVHMIVFAIPFSIFLTVVEFGLKETLIRYNIDGEFFRQVSILLLFLVYVIFLDKMIFHAIGIIQSLKRGDSR